jgi:predicted dehydrogenase
VEKIIKWGILGAGKIAAKFASDLNKTLGCELVAVASTSIDRAQQFAINHNVQYSFGSYQELFTTDLDVIYVATPHTFHKEHTLLCLNHGVGVLCEKPFAMSESEVDEMVNLARSKGVFLMEAMWSRFLPSFLHVKDAIDNGRIGEIKTIHADFGFNAVYDEKSRLFNPALGGGAFLDIGIYPAFLSLFLLGYPSKISASSIFAPTGTDETTSFVYQYDNQATALLNCTVGAYTDCEARIYGSHGSIRMHGRFHEATRLTYYGSEGEVIETLEFPRETFGYSYEIVEVNQCLRNGLSESPNWSLADSNKLIHLLDKTREVAKIVY